MKTENFLKLNVFCHLFSQKMHSKYMTWTSNQYQ